MFFVLLSDAHSTEEEEEKETKKVTEAHWLRYIPYNATVVVFTIDIAIAVAIAVGDFIDTTTSYASVNIYRYSTCVS